MDRCKNPHATATTGRIRYCFGDVVRQHGVSSRRCRSAPGYYPRPSSGAGLFVAEAWPQPTSSLARRRSARIWVMQ
jgi:hypothetical protein